jgi:hypothetical protein
MTDDSYAPTPARKGGGFAWTLALLLASFAAGMIGSPWFEKEVRSRLPAWAQTGAQPPAVSAGDSAKLAALEARIAAAEQTPAGAGLPADVAARIAALEATRTFEGAGAAAIATDLGPLGNRVTATEERLKVLEPAVQTATTAAAQIAAADARISALQTALAEQSARLRAFASLPPLRRALAAGAPAGAYVDALAAAVPAGSGDIALLRAAANRPLTLASLQRGFAQRQAIAATTAGKVATQSSDSWLETAMAQARALVGQGSAAKSAVASSEAVGRAAAALKRGEVEVAMQQLRLAPPAQSQRFNDWLVDAERYVGARAALVRLETQLALSASAPVTPPGTLPAVAAPAAPNMNGAL